MKANVKCILFAALSLCSVIANAEHKKHHNPTTYTFNDKTVTFKNQENADEFGQLINVYEELNDLEDRLRRIESQFDRVFMEYSNIERSMSYEEATLSSLGLENAISSLQAEIEQNFDRTQERFTEVNEMIDACKLARDQASYIVSFDSMEAYYDSYAHIRRCYNSFERISQDCRKDKRNVEARMKVLQTIEQKDK